MHGMHEVTGSIPVGSTSFSKERDPRHCLEEEAPPETGRPRHLSVLR
jgi:hypothetical protein